MPRSRRPTRLVRASVSRDNLELHVRVGKVIKVVSSPFTRRRSCGHSSTVTILIANGKSEQRPT